MPDEPTTGKPGTDAGAPKTGAPASSRPARRRRGAPKPRRLIDTRGPEPGDSVEDVRLTVGVILGSHGIQGELRMSLLTDNPEHLLGIEQVYLGDSDEPVRLDAIRFPAEGALIFLHGVDTPEAARALRGTPVRIAGSEAAPLEEGEVFLYQLIGLKAVTLDGAELGVVVDLIETGANDVLVIAPEGSRASRSPANEILIPHHRAYVHEVDPKGGRIVVTRPVFTDEVSRDS
jgi:16S rRNA processing protein RimM